MTSNMWDISLNDGTMGTLTPPDEIVAIQCKHLDKMTDEKVIARILPQRGSGTGYNSLASAFQFEFIITAPHVPYYRYSIMRIRYGIEYYPLTIEVDGDIAEEMGISVMSIIEVQDEDVFTSILSKIINSKKVKSVVNSLYSLHKSHERKNRVLFEEEDESF